MTGVLGKTGLLLAVLALVAPVAGAQDTIGIYIEDDDGLDRAGVTKVGEPFDVVVVVNASKSGGAIEFVMTELMHLFPGVFKFSTKKVNDTPLDLGNNQQGEYLIAYGGCVDAGSFEVVRLQYYDVDGSIDDNVVLGLSGLGPESDYPSTFDGQMGYISCQDEGVILVGEPWEHDDVIDPTRIEGVVNTDGIVVLNPVGLGVTNEEASVSTLKTRF